MFLGGFGGGRKMAGWRRMRKGGRWRWHLLVGRRRPQKGFGATTAAARRLSRERAGGLSTAAVPKAPQNCQRAADGAQKPLLRRTARAPRPGGWGGLGTGTLHPQPAAAAGRKAAAAASREAAAAAGRVKAAGRPGGRQAAARRTPAPTGGGASSAAQTRGPLRPATPQGGGGAEEGDGGKGRRGGKQ